MEGLLVMVQQGERLDLSQSLSSSSFFLLMFPLVGGCHLGDILP